MLQRYELLYEAGLIEEARRRSGASDGPTLGAAMIGDHRRILATGMARVRAKIKYNPVVFELMPPAFTLLQLQRCVEAIAGLNVHKPNFRRLIEQQQLVEETGDPCRTPAAVRPRPIASAPPSARNAPPPGPSCRSPGLDFAYSHDKYILDMLSMSIRP